MSGKEYGRKQSLAKLRYNPSICQEGLGKTMKTVRIAGLWAKI
jgi:hypothetical protein